MATAVPSGGTPYHFSAKVAILGDRGVGKTTLLDVGMVYKRGDRFRAITPANSNIPRVNAINGGNMGVSVRTHLFEVDRKSFQITFFDCPSYPRRNQTRYCAGVAAIVCVFDVSKIATYSFARLCLHAAATTLGPLAANVVRVLVGNTVGDGGEASRPRAVPAAAARAYAASQRRMAYVEAATVRGNGVKAVFDAVLGGIADNVPNPPEPSLLLSRGIKLGTGLLSNHHFRTVLFSNAWDRCEAWRNTDAPPAAKSRRAPDRPEQRGTTPPKKLEGAGAKAAEAEAQARKAEWWDKKERDRIEAQERKARENAARRAEVAREARALAAKPIRGSAIKKMHAKSDEKHRILGESRNSIDVRMQAKHQHEESVRARARKRTSAQVNKRATDYELLDRRLSEQYHRTQDVGRQTYSMLDLS